MSTITINSILDFAILDQTYRKLICFYHLWPRFTAKRDFLSSYNVLKHLIKCIFLSYSSYEYPEMMLLFISIKYSVPRLSHVYHKWSFLSHFRINFPIGELGLLPWNESWNKITTWYHFLRQKTGCLWLH